MNWFRENKFLGSFLIAFSVAVLIAGSLLLSTKSGFSEASNQFNQTATEFNRLQRLNPFPNDANLLAMKAQAADYKVALGKLKDELKTCVLPVTPLAPNEFQAQLRQTVTAVIEKARANKIKLPGNFFLGFDEFAAALPSNTAAPLLGQQLAQVKLLTDILMEARIDALTAFRVGPLPEERTAGGRTPTPSPSRGGKTHAVAPTAPKLVERSVVEATFVSTPSAARRVLNQIAGANKQFFIIRTLHVVNEKDKGPPRAEQAEVANPAATAAASPGPKPNAALNFIVGTEHIRTSAKIELVKFTF
jgi:hypothetical protein